MYYGLIPLGIFHLLISLFALGSGALCLIRDKAISFESTAGKVYVIATIVTCLSALGIYQHGAVFGKAHVLALITLAVLGAAFAADRGAFFGGASLYVETIGYSATFLFHLIPAITEAFTRLPYGSPIAASGEEPLVKAATGVLFLLFLVGAFLQVRRIRAST